MNASAPSPPSASVPPAHRPPGLGLFVAAERLTPYAIVLLGLALAWATQLSPWLRGGGRFVALPLGLAVAVLVLGSLVTSRWWRSRTVWAWLAFWIVWAATLPWTLRPAPMPAPDPVGAAHEAEQVRLGFKYPIEVPALSGREEVTQLALAALVTGAMLLLAGGSRRGVLAFRACWLAVVWTTAPVAVREIVADQHIITTRWGVWSFAANIPAGPFQNPNNYACVLACAVGVLLVWALDRPPRQLAVFLLVSAGVAALLAYSTGGRAAFVAIVLQALVALAVLVRRRRSDAAPGGSVGGHRTSGWSGRRIGAATGGAVALLIVATVLVPALRERNPLMRLLTPSDAEAASYDSLRVALSRTGLRYWWEHPWLGTGAGTFETRLATELPRDVSNQAINVHNAFVEILSQYGIVVFAPFAVLLGVLAWRAVRRPDDAEPTRLAVLTASTPGASSSPSGAGLTASTPGGSRDAPSGAGLTASTPHRGDATSGAVARQAVQGRPTIYRLELAFLLLLIAVTALDVSSALALPMWFVMIAHATQVGRVLEDR